MVNKYIPQSWILSSNKRTLLVQGICRNEDLRSAVVVGLPHNSLKNLHWGWQNFWLTVLTGISDPEPVFDFHSSPLSMSESFLLFLNSMDSTPADKVLKKTLLDLQKRFPIYHMCPKCLAAHSLRLGITIERLSIPPGNGWGGKDTGRLVSWECPLRTDSASWKSLESFIQLI